MEVIESTKLKRIISILLVFTIIFNMFLPYGSQAAFNQDGQAKYNVLRISDITKSSSGNYTFYVEYAAIGDTYVGSFDMSLSYDSTLFGTARKDTGAANTTVARITETNSDYFTFQTKTVSGGQIRMTGTTTDWWCPDEDGDASDNFGSEISIFKVYFYLLDPSQWKLDGSKEITADMISCLPTGSLQSGYKQRIADDIDGTNPQYITSLDYLATEGFVEASKEVTEIAVKTNPSDTTYEHGDTIDLTGGLITVTYDDGSTEDIEMTNSDVTISSPADGKADAEKPTVTVSYKGKTATINLTVTDPVQSLAVTKSMTDVEYDQGDQFDFSGLELTATKKSGATVTLDSTSTGVTISETVADVESNNFTQTSAEGVLPVKGTQKIIFTYEGKTTTQTVVVNDTITGITLKSQPNKTVYKRGEELDLTGAVVEIALQSGATTDVKLPDGTIKVSTYSAVATGTKQKLEVSFGTYKASQTIDVEVYDYIASATLTPPNKVQYKYNEDLQLTGGILKLNWRSGSMTTVGLENSMITGYNKTTIGTQTVTVTYNVNYTLSDGTTIPDQVVKTFEVEVTNPAKSIEITAPSKTEYNHGESLDLSNGTIVVTYENDTTKNITMTAAMIKEEDGSQVDMTPAASDYTNYELIKTLKIEYTEDEVTNFISYPITIKNNVTGITMESVPDTTKYALNDTEYDLTGGSIKVTRAAGDKHTVELSDSNVTLTSLSELSATVGTKKVTVTYEGKTTSFDITITDEIASIEITKAPSKTSYGYKDELVLSGGEIKVTTESGVTSTIDMTDPSVTITEVGGGSLDLENVTFGADNKATKTVQVNYEGKTATFDITIINKITKIEMHTTPKTQYNVKDELDVEGGEILVTRQTGTPSVEPITESMVTGFDSSVEKENLSLTVTYEENGESQTTAYEVIVKDTVKSIEVKTAPTTVKFGEDLDLSTATIEVERGSGKTTIPVTAEMISGFDKEKLGPQTVTVKYGEKEDTFEVTVEDYVKDIILTKPSKLEYEYDEEFTLAGGKVQKVMASGESTTPVDLSDDAVTVSTPDMKKLGTQTITVTYAGKTTSFDITVTDEIASIEITSAPAKTSYGYKDELVLSGGEIKVTTESGVTSTIDMTDPSVTITEVGGGSLDLENVTFGADNKATKTVQVNYEGKTATFDITIINKITKIEMHTTPKTEYNVNDELDVTNGEILVTRQTGTPSIVQITENMVTGFDSSAEKENLSLTVTYEENGESQTTAYEVTVKDTVKSIEVKTAPTTVKFGEELDLSTATIEVERGSGKVTIPVTAEMLSGFDKNKVNQQTVTVTYAGKEDTFVVTVQDYVTGIKVVPSSVEGIYGTTLAELITSKNIKYVVTYASKGDTTPVALEEAMASTYNPNSTSEQTLTITYTDNDADSFTNGQSFTADLKITLIDNVNSVSITGAPTESLYGEELDLSGMTITVSRDSGTDTVPVADATITGFDKEKLGPQVVTVEYGGKKATFTIEVKDYLKDIILTPPTKNEYKWSTTETLDLAGGSVRTVMASGAEGAPVGLDDPSVSLSAFVPNQEGTQTITVTYEGKTKTFDVTVIDEIYSIVVNGAPSSVDYGKEIDLTGATITITKDSGVTTIPVTKDMLSNYDSTDLSGTQTVTVTYEGKTDTFDITVNDYVVDFVLTAPSKTTYEYGESLDLSDAIITKITASGANTETVPVTADMISGYDNTKLGAQTVTVTYEGIQKTFGVTVVDNIQSIAMATTPKTEYKYGESLDVTGGTITVTRSSGSEVIDITPAMVSGFDPNTLGPQTLTVTYAGQTTSYTVNVTDYVEKITIVAPTKVVYNLNDPLDLTGGQVSVIMASGAVRETVAMDASMISGFDSSTAGAKTLTVTYAEKTATFGITVVDPLAGMSIVTLPKVDYLYGEAMDLTGGSIQVTKESGEQQVIPMDASMISGFTTNTLGQVLVTVNYEGLQDSFYINVTDYEAGATLVAPNKTTYEYGEDLDLTGGLIKITMASGAVKEEAALTASMVSGFNNKTVGTQTLTVTFKGYTKTFNVTVKDTLGGITLNSEPNKTQYKYGENIDLTGATIKVIRTSGTTIENITPDMISGYNPNVAGYQVVTVTFEGFTTQFVVCVHPKEAPIPEDTTPQPQPEPTPAPAPAPAPTPVPAPAPKPQEKPKKPTSVKPVEKTEEKIEDTLDNESSETEDVVESPIETPVVEDEDKVENVVEKTEEKPTITLGEKDEEGNKPKTDDTSAIAKGMLLIAAIFLFLLLILRKNTKIYVQENGKTVLGGQVNLTKDNLEIDVNEYLDGETYNGKIKIVLNDSISEKLDGKEITIKHRDQIVKVKVKYEDEPFEINLN